MPLAEVGPAPAAGATELAGSVTFSWPRFAFWQAQTRDGSGVHAVGLPCYARTLPGHSAG